MDHQIRTISLFSGGGGLDIGFEHAGFNILFATDFNHECCETLKLNRGRTLGENLTVIETDINDLVLELLPKNVDLIIGGPPCQSFSASGRRAGGAAGQLDQRGQLFKNYCRVVNYVQPKAFLFENVRGILATNHGNDFKNIIDSFQALGYTIDYRILDAEDYGVPQQRERLFIVGHKSKKRFLFPKPLYGPDSTNESKYITVADAINDLVLSDAERDETKFENGRYAHLLPLVPPGENYLHFTANRGYPNPIFAYRSRFSDFLYKADPNKPVKTLIASPGKYTGPLHWENRYLTVREYKRIQGFPDTHLFYGDRKDQIRQIGNSVCPKIAYYLALSIREQIFGISSNIDYLGENDRLSFDKRKGQKAQKTRALHQAVIEEKMDANDRTFQIRSFKTHAEPSTAEMHNNVNVVRIDNQNAHIDVYADENTNVQVCMHITVFDDVKKKHEIGLDIALYGKSEHSIQTMWNAVDAWVKKSSHFCSLIELYGHFTEPHPLFRIDSFSTYSDLPIIKFAEQCTDFKKCSVYFKKSQLLSMWGTRFSKKSFIELEKLLRGYRFDIRSHETNIAIPNDVYMVAYPFTLPYDKQMNIIVHDKGAKNMTAKKIAEKRPDNLDKKLLEVLNRAYETADDYFVTKNTEIPEFAKKNLASDFIETLDEIASLCEKASTGYLNILTSLTIKAALGSPVDVRYHQVQIQDQTPRPAGFNFRGVSEQVMYEWMQAHEFPGAKSGWQTRTFERPKPYMLDYDENIGAIKKPFLACYDYIETQNQDAFYALSFLLWRREQLRDLSKITLSIPKLTNVQQITELFEKHFFYRYKDPKGASRLPVLALYAIYQVLISELQRYEGKGLKELQAHSAADSQTGAIGDIEVTNSDGTIFEAVEVKHDIQITVPIIDSAKQKIRGSQVERYYILTTHKEDSPSDEVLEAAEQVEKLLGCQMIVNGVIPSIKYYLRLLTAPGKVLPAYVNLLSKDTSISFEHKDIWNKITTGMIE